MTSHATGDGHIHSRNTNKKGLKRIMTVGGVYGTRNYTVKDLRDQKGKQTLTETVPFSIKEAAAAEEAGIDTMKVRFDPKNPDYEPSTLSGVIIDSRSDLSLPGCVVIIDESGLKITDPLIAFGESCYFRG